MRAAVGLLMAAGCLTAFGQPTDVAPRLEVASVRPSPPPPDPNNLYIRSSGGPGTKEPERYTAENLDFAGLVMYAYEIKRHQISGPDWIRAVRYHVSAKVPPGASKEQFRLMLQNLLTERFGFKAHWESRDEPVYDLVVAKGGPKLKGARPEAAKDAEHAPAQAAKGPAGFPSLPPGDEPVMLMASGNGRAMAALRARSETAAQIAAQVSHLVGIPVRDATGLTGKYDYTLYWVAGSSSEAAAAIPSGGAMPLAQSESPGPNVFEAVQQQLGLRLESKRGPVPILVIDSVEKTPTEN